jgi:hypothetical protein
MNDPIGIHIFVNIPSTHGRRNEEHGKKNKKRENPFMSHIYPALYRPVQHKK